MNRGKGNKYLSPFALTFPPFSPLYALNTHRGLFINFDKVNFKNINFLEETFFGEK